MSLPKIEKLIKVEDELNQDLSDRILPFEECGDEDINLSLKSEVKLGDRKLKIKDSEELPNEEELLGLVRDIHSGLFYKIENHLHILSLSSHFSEWKKEGKNFFSFYSYLNNEDSLSSLLALAAYYEHKENLKSLILCEKLDFVDQFGSGLTRSEYADAVQISEMIHFGSLYDFISNNDPEVLEAEIDVLKDEYDFIFLLYPKHLKAFLVTQNVKVLCLNTDNVNYIFSDKGTSRKHFKETREEFKKIGIPEGGIIMGDDCD